MNRTYSFTSPLWEWPSRANWFFVSVPIEMSEEIGDVPILHGGFNSIPVSVTIGETTWKTSIFPGGGHGEYSVPIKASVRKAEGIDGVGQPVDVTIELIG
jgi:hypothetical protein